MYTQAIHRLMHACMNIQIYTSDTHADTKDMCTHMRAYTLIHYICLTCVTLYLRKTNRQPSGDQQLFSCAIVLY